MVPEQMAHLTAIVRHQVIPVSLIIRRGVQYLLAKNALRLILALPLAGLVLSVYVNRQRSLEVARQIFPAAELAAEGETLVL